MKWLAVVLAASAAAAQDRIVILFDSAAAPPLASGWGYSAYIEHGGKRILFDTGPSPGALGGNAKALGIDLAKLDAVVISHDDSDHFAGLPHIYAVHRDVPVYVPLTEYGAFGLSGLNTFFRFFERLMPRNDVVDPPKSLRYTRVGSATTITPGVRLIPFDFGDGRREQALILERPEGALLFSGCAHPGILKMVRGAGKPVHTIVGGFHLIEHSGAELGEVAADLKKAGVRAAVPGHCTGAGAVREFKRQFGAGLNSIAAGGSYPLAK